ncbi:MAG: helix-turn-helix transcriptional regulator [Aridibacter sp.]
MDKIKDGQIIVLTERINKNLQKDWTVKELFESIGISEPHLQKKFKDATGMSPMKYIKHLRLEKAAELLTDREFLPIQQICQKVGINDQTHFTRDFKKKYGKTPTQYSKDFWNNYSAEKKNA